MQSSRTYPSLQSLLSMLAVYRQRSFTRAGLDLGLTQTAVSHQIAQLERWLGYTLFLRGRAGVELTPEAGMIVPGMTEAMEGLLRVLDEARSTEQGRKLRISTTSEFATQWLQQRLPGFCSANPSIDVSVTIEYRRAQLDVENVGVAIWLMGAPAHDGAFRLTDDHELVVCSPGLLAKLPAMDALLEAPLLRYEGARHTVLDWERWHGQLYGRTASEGERSIGFDSGPCFPTFADMVAACEAGDGFALVRTSLVADRLAAGKLVQAFVETVRSDLQYHLVSTPTQRKRAEVVAFRAWLVRAMGLAE
ncbi:LysR substrate-binding domain-containing protein [Mesorhizobium sp. NPDC059025]|jgi:LysR family glycine cleavage system transcriptional activator|uniref:LysR substrate-binding domain-containing protein n=1 Tax=unclassified Mesorhizobium TaxID=325217 RepID=UPI003696DB6E